MINREQLLTDLDNVHDFLRSIDDPCADSVAMAAAILSGAGTIRTAARLLTLEEVRGWEGFLWLELAAPIIDSRQTVLYKAVLTGEEGGALYFHLRDDLHGYEKSAVYYGLRFRCWASRPSADEMAAVPWDED